MDSTAQWFYVSVLRGQKLDQVSGLNSSILRLLIKFWLLVLAYIEKIFLLGII